MIDIVADMLGRAPPIKLQVPRAVLRILAPLAGNLTGHPRGAIAGFVEALAVDSVGDPTLVRTMLPGPRLGFRESVDLALNGANRRNLAGVHVAIGAAEVGAPASTSKPINPLQEILK
jgi:hypothetical protein